MTRNSDPWLRLYVRTLNNPKVQRLPLGDFKGWVNLLCLAKEHDGDIPPAEDVAFRLRLSKRKAEALLKSLKFNGLIDGDKMHNWDEMQYQSDSSSERVKRHRERSKAQQGVSSNVSSNVSETVQIQKQSRTETEQNRNRAETEVPARASGRSSAKSILDHWNTLDALTSHVALTEKTAVSINARLNAGYSEADLCRAITRYAELCQQETAPGHNHWSLFLLMSREEGGWIDKMLDPKYEGITHETANDRRRKRNAEVLGVDSEIPRLDGGDTL